MSKSSSDIQKVMVRMPDGLHGRVIAAATLDNRSMNNFVVAAIVEKLDRTERLELMLDKLEQATQVGQCVDNGSALQTIDRMIKLLTTQPGSKVLQ